MPVVHCKNHPADGFNAHEDKPLNPCQRAIKKAATKKQSCKWRKRAGLYCLSTNHSAPWYKTNNTSRPVKNFILLSFMRMQ